MLHPVWGLELCGRRPIRVESNRACFMFLRCCVSSGKSCNEWHRHARIFIRRFSVYIFLFLFISSLGTIIYTRPRFSPPYRNRNTVIASDICWPHFFLKTTLSAVRFWLIKSYWFHMSLRAFIMGDGGKFGDLKIWRIIILYLRWVRQWYNCVAAFFRQNTSCHDLVPHVRGSS